MGAQDQDQEHGDAVAVRERKPAIGLHNEVLSPDKWTLFGRIATSIANTEFVPKALRGKPDAVMACLLYGDSLGLHPSVSLTDVYITDGKPGVSGALMAAKIREAGHKLKYERIDKESDQPYSPFHGWTVIGQRMKDGEVEDEFEWTFTMDNARQMGLYPNESARAAWMKTPDVMCLWRAIAQLSRFLFPDVFRGQAIYTPDEAEQAAHAQDTRARNGARDGERMQTPRDIAEELRSMIEDQWLAQRLVDLFAACNAQDGVEDYLPARQRLEVAGKDEKELYELVAQLERKILDAGGQPPQAADPQEFAQKMQADAETVDGEAEEDIEFPSPRTGDQAQIPT